MGIYGKPYKTNGGKRRHQLEANDSDNDSTSSKRPKRLPKKATKFEEFTDELSEGYLSPSSGGEEDGGNHTDGVISMAPPQTKKKTMLKGVPSGKKQLNRYRG